MKKNIIIYLVILIITCAISSSFTYLLGQRKGEEKVLDRLFQQKLTDLYRFSSLLRNMQSGKEKPIELQMAVYSHMMENYEHVKGVQNKGLIFLMTAYSLSSVPSVDFAMESAEKAAKRHNAKAKEINSVIEKYPVLK